MYAHARAKFRTTNISMFLLFRVEKIFAIFNSVVLSDYENISTTKFPDLQYVLKGAYNHAKEHFGISCEAC